MEVLPLLDLIDSGEPKPGRRTFRVTGLFAGIGGLERGLADAGHDTRLLCELDPGAQAVLRARFPDVPIHDDVSTLGSVADGTELLVGGFPCQDLSQAGRTAGISGSRSGLVGHIFRLLDAGQVEHVLLENVPFMLQLDRGAAMDLLVTEFEARGYRWAYRVVNSLAFGVPQRRRRVLFLASRSLDPNTVLFDADHEPPETPPHEGIPCGFYWTEGLRGLGWAVDGVPTLKGGSGIGIPSPPAIWFPDGFVGTPDIRDAERLQGFPADWTAPSSEVTKPSHRWRLVGNAVTVDVAKWIGSRLASPWPSHRPRTLPLVEGRSWPSAGCGQAGERHRVEIGEWPVLAPRRPLETFLQYDRKPLSVRATAGFLSRTERSSLRFPAGFLEALRTHLGQQSGEAAESSAA